MSRPVVVIGDCIIDEVEFATARQRFPGGAGLNLATGLAHLDTPTVFVTRYGQDRDGYRLERHARARGLCVVNTPNVESTGIAYSDRKLGEPRYWFSPALYRRRIFFPPRAMSAMADAAVIAMNSISLDDGAQVARLVEIMEPTRGKWIVDPNPREALIADVEAFRKGFEAILPFARVVKLSDEDARLLYGSDARSVVPLLFSAGVEAAVLTHGAAGATALTSAGVEVHEPSKVQASALVDAMGAGDATLAVIVSEIVRTPLPWRGAQWQECLRWAMAVAAATCERAGGEIALPPQDGRGRA